MKELIYARLYLPAIQKYGENTGIIDGPYQSDWNMTVFYAYVKVFPLSLM